VDSRGKRILVKLGHVSAHATYLNSLSDEDEGVNAAAEL
jgi:hypothetical protein